MDVHNIIREIESHMNGPVSNSMKNFGIGYKLNYGVSIPLLRDIAQKYKGNHELALELFQREIRECKIVASMIADPSSLTGEQIDNWAQSFTNIEIVEQVCSNLLWKSEYALSRSIEWCLSCNELLQRAGLIIAARSANNQDAKDIVFEPYLDIIDNFDDDVIAPLKSPIEFTLRQIGKRNSSFREKVLNLAQKMADSDNEHRAWIGSQILFELSENEN
jgi:3-methyladenine DNA glycosylase AlkD